MMRKGQITIFVILGLVLGTLVILSFMFREGIVEQASKVGIIKELAMSKESRKVQSDMKECMEDAAYDSLIKLGLQGGYVDLGRLQYTQLPEATGLDYEGTAYLYYKGQKKTPTLKQMQNELEKDLTTRSTNCKKEYKEFSVSYGRAIPKVEIKENKITFNINWVVEIQKEESKSIVKYVTFEVPLRLERIRNVVNEIIEEQTEEICLSCMAETGFKNDMIIDVEEINEDIFYLITDEKSKIRDKNYMFLIANKF